MAIAGGELMACDVPEVFVDDRHERIQRLMAASQDIRSVRVGRYRIYRLGNIALVTCHMTIEVNVVISEIPAFLLVGNLSPSIP